MDQTSLLSQRSKLIKVVLFIVLFLVAVFLVNNYVFRAGLTITVEGGDSQKTIDIKVSDAKGKEISQKKITSNKPASLRLPAGNLSVAASQANSETIGYANLQRFKTSHLQLKLSPQQNINKLGSESLGCDFLDKTVLYSYSCTKNSVILRHQNPPNQFVDPVPLLGGELSLPTPKAYLGGLLSKFGGFESVYLNFVDVAANQAKLIKTPAGFDIESALVVVDEANVTSNQRFLLVDQAGKIYSYENINDSQPKEIQLPDEPPTKLLAKRYSLTNNKLVVYAGKDEASGDGEEELKAQSELKANFLFTAELSQTPTAFKTIKIPLDLINSEVHLIDNDHLALINNSGVSVYDTKNDDPKLVAYFVGTNYFYPGSGGSLWLINNNSLYRYSVFTNQAIKIFNSDHLRLSRVFSLGGDTLLNAFVENDKSSVLHSYSIEDRPADMPRLEDKLPYISNSSLPVLKMEYSGNTIKIQLALSSLGSDKQTGQIFYEPSEFESAKKKVLEKLKSDGFDLQKLQVNFTF